MTIRQINIQRLSVISSRPFETVVAALDAVVGHPNIADFSNSIGTSKDHAEMADPVHRSLGTSGFMEFARFDIGAVLRKKQGQGTPRSLRLVIGNPLIMEEMAKHVPDAGSY